MNVGQRIKELRKEKGLTQEELGLLIGVKKSAVAKYENNRVENLKRTTIKKLADVFDVSPSIFIIDEEETVIYNKVFKIPVFKTVPCGVPMAVIEWIVDYEKIDEKAISNGSFYGLRALDDSMYPNIMEDDILIIKQTSIVDSGKIAIVKVNEEEATCKKIIISDSGITIVPFNSSYDPIHYSRDDIKKIPVSICGEVVEIRRKM